MSAHLQWMIVKDQSSFLVKKRNIKKWFSIDPLNPKGLHSRKFSGTTSVRALTVEPHPSNKGVQLVAKRRKGGKKVAKQLCRVPLTKGARRTMVSITNWVKGSGGYRRDLRKVCMRRACAILKSQRAIVPKRKVVRGTKKAD
ncbi:large ribosomal subunit protein eL28-like [Ornithodoros turicata]|uniref:large ribosomal subunit protein eL28-like n=1 Tax=Ornithodoros turicata TaxID=34597 RepID=UPI003139E2DB